MTIRKLRVGVLVVAMSWRSRCFSSSRSGCAGAAGALLSARWQLGEKSAGGTGDQSKLLADAVAFAQGRESSREMDFSDQERIFGSLLGSVPTRRAKTNGLVIYKGYVVAEFGDTTWVDPTYSVAKSVMATVPGIGYAGRINARRPGRQDRQGRRLRLAAQRAGHLEDAPAAGDRVGRHHVRQEGRLRRHRGVRRRRAEAARTAAAGHLLRV